MERPSEGGCLPSCPASHPRPPKRTSILNHRCKRGQAASSNARESISCSAHSVAPTFSLTFS